MKKDLFNFLTFPLKHLSRYTFRYCIYCLIKIINVVLLVIQPFVWAQVLQDIYSPDKSTVLCHILQFVTIEIAQVASVYFGELSQNHLEQGMITDLKGMMISAVVNFKMSVINKAKVGEFVSKFHSDVVAIVEFWNKHMPNFVFELIKVIVMAVIISLVDFKLFLIITVILAIFSFVFISFGKEIQKRYSEFRKVADVYFSNMHETINNIREIKNLGIKKRTVNHSCEIFEDIRKGELSYNDLGVTSQFVTGAINTVLILVVLLYSAHLVICGNMTAVKFVVFFSYVSRFSLSVKDISRINTKLQQGRISYNRIDGILFDSNNFETCTNAQESIDDINTIEFKDVGFSYDKENEVLKGLTFEIRDKSICAIVGPSGNGKSTLLNLLSRLYEDYSGEIKTNGIEIKSISENCYRKFVSRVFQEPLLFNMSIKDNLLISSKDVSMNKVKEICKRVGIHSFIEYLPQGYETIVNENSNNLSVGQKQRLAIARSLLSDAKVLLFDEVTSALDNETQEIVLKTINECRENHIMIVVSHKIANIITSDKIIVLEDGGIAGIGTHNELLKSCELYNTLYSKECEKSTT